MVAEELGNWEYWYIIFILNFLFFRILICTRNTVYKNNNHKTNANNANRIGAREKEHMVAIPPLFGVKLFVGYGLLSVMMLVFGAFKNGNVSFGVK